MKRQFAVLIFLALSMPIVVVYPQDQQPTEMVWGNYFVTSYSEIGYRWREITGSTDKYRSDINLGRGPRVFGVNFDSQSVNHEGLLYDRLNLNSSGWGGDPNRWGRLMIEKNKFYKFTMTYRQFDYFNFLPEFALNQHGYDISRRMSDFNLELLPGSPVKMRLGLSRNSSYGSTFTTFDFARDEFLVLEPLRRENTDYRIGVDWKVLNTVFSYDQSFRAFKNDRHLFQNVPFNPGNNRTSLLNQFDRLQPIRGFTPVERFSVRSRFFDKFDFTGQFVYSRARVNFTRNETLNGVDFRRVRLAETILSNGISTKPNPLLDLGLSYHTTSKLTISNTFRFTQFGINGATFGQTMGTGTAPNRVVTPINITEFFSRFTGLKSYANLINLEYSFNRKFQMRLGYRFTNRRVDERRIDGNQADEEITKLNTHTGIVGVSARPWKELSVFADYENGTSDNSFTRVSPFHIKNWRVRTQYRPSTKLSFGGSFVRRDNTVPTPFTTNRFSNTSYSISSTWVPTERFVLNLGYNRLAIDSEANIVFFIANRLNRGRSFYESNTNFAYGNAILGVTKKLEVALGYRLVKDTGTDRPSLGPNDFVSSFPLSSHQPSVKVSYKFINNLKWTLGYDYFSYKEKRFNIQDYHANIVYSTLGVGF